MVSATLQAKKPTCQTDMKAGDISNVGRKHISIRLKDSTLWLRNLFVDPGQTSGNLDLIFQFRHRSNDQFRSVR